jgi:hypothetical protein
LTNLYWFSVTANQLTGNIPALAGLSNLSAFEVSENPVRDHPRTDRVAQLNLYA